MIDNIVIIMWLLGDTAISLYDGCTAYQEKWSLYQSVITQEYYFSQMQWLVSAFVPELSLFRVSS